MNQIIHLVLLLILVSISTATNYCNWQKTTEEVQSENMTAEPKFDYDEQNYCIPNENGSNDDFRSVPSNSPPPPPPLFPSIDQENNSPDSVQQELTSIQTNELEPQNQQSNAIKQKQLKNIFGTKQRAITGEIQDAIYGRSKVQDRVRENIAKVDQRCSTKDKEPIQHVEFTKLKPVTAPRLPPNNTKPNLNLRSIKEMNPIIPTFPIKNNELNENNESHYYSESTDSKSTNSILYSNTIERENDIYNIEKDFVFNPIFKQSTTSGDIYSDFNQQPENGEQNESNEDSNYEGENNYENDINYQEGSNYFESEWKQNGKDKNTKKQKETKCCLIQ